VRDSRGVGDAGRGYVHGYDDGAMAAVAIVLVLVLVLVLTAVVAVAIGER
jgi:hypothetical protein